MKKSTSKRDRKYGRKTEDGVVEKVPSKKAKPKKVSKPTEVMIDYAYIMKFKSKKEADEFIEKQDKEAKESRRPLSSFVFV